jgi:hypothetical protein
MKTNEKNERMETAKKALSAIANRFDDIDAADHFWAYVEDISDCLYSD